MTRSAMSAVAEPAMPHSADPMTNKTKPEIIDPLISEEIAGASDAEEERRDDEQMLRDRGEQGPNQCP